MSTPDPTAPTVLTSPVPPMPPGNAVGRILMCYLIDDPSGAQNAYAFAEINLSQAWSMALVVGPDNNPFYQEEGSRQAAANALRDIIQRKTIASGGR